MLSFILIAKAVIMKSIPIELKRTHTFYIYLKKREKYWAEGGNSHRSMKFTGH